MHVLNQLMKANTLFACMAGPVWCWALHMHECDELSFWSFQKVHLVPFIRLRTVQSWSSNGIYCRTFVSFYLHLYILWRPIPCLLARLCLMLSITHAWMWWTWAFEATRKCIQFPFIHLGQFKAGRELGYCSCSLDNLYHFEYIRNIRRIPGERISIFIIQWQKLFHSQNVLNVSIPLYRVYRVCPKKSAPWKDDLKKL